MKINKIYSKRANTQERNATVKYLFAGFGARFRFTSHKIKPAIGDKKERMTNPTFKGS